MGGHTGACCVAHRCMFASPPLSERAVAGGIPVVSSDCRWLVSFTLLHGQCLCCFRHCCHVAKPVMSDACPPNHVHGRVRAWCCVSTCSAGTPHFHQRCGVAVTPPTAFRLWRRPPPRLWRQLTRVRLWSKSTFSVLPIRRTNPHAEI